MRCCDPRRKKARDLRRIARSDCGRIFALFHKYHPEIKELQDKAWQESSTYYCLSPDWHIYQDLEYGWATKIAGYWDALGGAPSSGFRRMHNRLHRNREKVALRKAIQNEDLEDFSIPRKYRDIRWLWF